MSVIEWIKNICYLVYKEANGSCGGKIDLVWYVAMSDAISLYKVLQNFPNILAIKIGKK